jgi:hypothetical protein
MKVNGYFVAGGISSAIASLLHIVMIIGGPDWYRFFGAGEGMAQLAENGSSYPTIITTIIAIILALWGLYAFSGAGVIGRLPLLKLVLGIISMIYIMRGVFGIPIVIYLDHPYLNELEEKMTFMIFSSFISLSFGLFYLIGSIQISSNTMNQGHIAGDKKT